LTGHNFYMKNEFLILLNFISIFMKK